ncbi:MAG TPA: UbiA-like polyprenyltransferase [bacterium]|nr:UbiA-like polyprenyltransferase [bacterium]
MISLNPMLSKVRHVSGMLKLSHTVFALPFALASMLAAAGGLPSWRLAALILLAMVTARNAGMAFNRYLDAGIDARNPRTASRHVPQGLLSGRFVLVFSLVNALLFLAVARAINPLCLALSPAALALLFGYSYMKRVSSLSHLVLGLVLGSSPIAAWIAVRGTFNPPPFVLGLAVAFWVAGFDVIYATQDHDFDRREGLHSLVVRFGVARALVIARVFHAATIVLFVAFGLLLRSPWPYFATIALTAALLTYEHSLVKAEDLSRVNAAFFTVNGFISLIFLAGIALAIINY